MEVELRHRAEGAPPRDVSGYLAWRTSARPENLELLRLYADYIAGMTDGFSGALHMESVKAVFEIEQIPKRLWPSLSRRLLKVHSIVMQHQKVKKGKAS